MDRVVMLALRQLQQARENLRQAIADAPRDGSWPKTLAAVRDSGLVTVSELAEWAGVSRGYLYELLAQADDEH